MIRRLSAEQISRGSVSGFLGEFVLSYTIFYTNEMIFITAVVLLFYPVIFIIVSVLLNKWMYLFVNLVHISVNLVRNVRCFFRG